MSEWKESTIGDLVQIKNGFAFKGEDFVEAGVPVIKIKNVKPNKILLDTLSYVSEEVASGKDSYLIQPNDILITMSGNRSDGSPDSWVGKVALFKKIGRYLLNQRVSIVRVDENKASTPFIAYYLSSWENQVYLINQANSSGGQANIAPDTIKAMEISLPSLKEQKAIASVLSSLDDKIDLLHRQNATLEAMAETLFRQWFVEGEQKDWDNGNIADLFILQRGFDLPTQNRLIGKYPIISSNGTNGTHSEYKVKGPGVTTGRSGSLGQVFYIDQDFWPLNTSLFIVDYKRSTPLFAYYYLKSLDIISLNAGSAVPTLNRNDVHSIETKIPPMALISDFEDFSQSLFLKLRTNNRQITTLTTLRDTLLPKLMNGEVRVKS